MHRSQGKRESCCSARSRSFGQAVSSAFQKIIIDLNCMYNILIRDFSATNSNPQDCDSLPCQEDGFRTFTLDVYLTNLPPITTFSQTGLVPATAT